MTTAVKVDAHAGKSVIVTLRYGEPGAKASISTVTVEPDTERTFYLHSGLKILNMEEAELTT